MYNSNKTTVDSHYAGEPTSVALASSVNSWMILFYLAHSAWADRAILYILLALILSFLTIFWYFLQTSYLRMDWTDIHDFFHQIDNRSGPLFWILKGRCRGNKFWAKICNLIFIWQACILKQIGIWQFWFKNIQWQYCRYILCKFD